VVGLQERQLSAQLFKSAIAVRRPLLQNQLHLQEGRPSARLFKNSVAVRRPLLHNQLRL
jgi:hypothetical protein